MKPLFSYQYQNFVFETYNQKPLLKIELKELNQIHSNRIEPLIRCSLSEADGFSYFHKDLHSFIPAIKTADCLPIWLIGEKRQFLIHAGWRGLQKNILQDQMIQNEKIVFALIGPSIQVKSFEVQEGFKKEFPESSFFQNIDTKLTFNLQEYAKNEIQKYCPKQNIFVSDICTFDDIGFHSYRRDKTLARNWSIVRALV